MAPSPRKATAPAFEHSWSDADVSFLDPNGLPIAKVPRAWERKQETKITVGGKQKKVWRRYTTRSRTTTVAPEGDDHEDDHDSRFRPVKKLQRMSPRAIEKSNKLKWPKKNAFKATRWDRRKSVLPRKRTARNEPTDDDNENASSSSEDCQAGEDADISNNSFSEMDASTDLTFEPATVPENKDRRSTFTFSVRNEQEETVMTDTAPLEKPHVEQEAEQDATLENFFRSPVKNAPAVDLHHPTEDVAYPDLTHSVDMETDATNVPEDAPLATEPQKEDNSEGALANTDTLEDHNSEEESKEQPMLHSESMDMTEEQKATDSPVRITELSYPSLPAEASNQEHMDVEGLSEDENEDASESEMTSTSVQEEGGLACQVNETPGNEEEEFTEASLQQHIQQDMVTEQKDQPSASPSITHDLPEPISVPREKMEIDVSVGFTQEHTTNDKFDSSTKPEFGNDIADGLTLGPTTTPLKEPTSRRLRSPSPPPIQHGPEDTMTMALDDDTAMLKDFLSRAAASKANKATTISRRESLQNRRDSDVVRHALASPRKVLEDKDPNSPSKHDNEVTLDLSQTLTLNMDQPPLSPTGEQASTETTDDTVTKASRRSSRTRKSRLPAPASAQPVGPSKIAVRRADGGEPVVLKKSDAQELSQLTRANTRKNKQGAFAVSIRLLKLSKDASRRVSDDDTAEPSANNVVPVPGKKYVRWDEQLAYYQEGTDTIANMLAEAESLATPDELSLPDPASTRSKPKTPKVPPKEKKAASSTGTSTPKIRRVRGLGTSNGTPGKGLLTPASLLPDAVQEEKDQQPATNTLENALPKPKSKTKSKSGSSGSGNPKKVSVPETVTPDQPPSTKLPTLEIAPVGIEPTTSSTRKSRLASPKKVKLPQPPSSASSDGKENHALQQQQQKVVGIAGATPKKGMIPVLMGIPAGMGVVGGGNGAGGETGLPRRRLRRL